MFAFSSARLDLYNAEFKRCLTTVLSLGRQHRDLFVVAMYLSFIPTQNGKLNQNVRLTTTSKTCISQVVLWLVIAKQRETRKLRISAYPKCQKDLGKFSII
jgi:hypothetical protein